MIKTLLLLVFLVGCSTARLYERGEYIDTVCSGFLGKGECKEVTRNGLHITKKMRITGLGAKYDFEKKSGEGTKVLPDLSGLQFREN